MTATEYAWGRILAELLMLGAGLAFIAVVLAIGFVAIVVLDKRK